MSLKRDKNYFYHFTNGNKKVALITGHSEEDQGAENQELKITEFGWNSDLILRVEKLLKENSNIGYIKTKRNTRGEYYEEQALINNYAPDLAIHFHLNAYNKKANGSLVEIYKGSKKGMIFANIIFPKILKVLKTKVTNDGIVELDRGDRGYSLVSILHAPAIILEPFFIDNTEEFIKCDILKQSLAEVISNSIIEFMDLI